MNHLRSTSIVAIALVCALLMAGCAGMDRRERGTAVGATVGGVAGAIVTDGSPAGAVAGAVVGGVVGSEASKRR